MRQGEVATQGKWTGDPSGGVKAPPPLILPDPATRFARSAARLDALSIGHPMQDWLRFMARLEEAQHAVAMTLRPFVRLERIAVERAADARMPPLAVDGHRRDAAWRGGLAVLLETLDGQAMPAAARAVAASLRDRSADAVEVLADRFLLHEVEPAEAAAALYIAAALQVYFTCSAGDLPAAHLRLLTQRGLCPCCGSTPVSGVVTAAGQTPGTRYLHCSLCSTAWNHVRAVCITCGEARALSLQGIEGDAGAVKAETCGVCHTYAKMLYQIRDIQVDPVADDLATLGLDLLLADAGWSRHAPNPLLLVGSGVID